MREPHHYAQHRRRLVKRRPRRCRSANALLGHSPRSKDKPLDALRTVRSGIAVRGWRLHRIWGPSWYRHRAEQEGRLRQAIEGAVTELRFDPPATHRPERVRVDTIETVIIEPTGPPAWAVPYKSANLPRLRGNCEMHEPEAEDDLKRLILAVVGAEGPVHEERILRRARAFQTERAGRRRRGDV